LYSHLRTLFMMFKVLKVKLESTKKDMSTRIVSQDLLTQGAEERTSIGTLGTQSSRGTRQNLQSRTLPPMLVQSNLASSSRRKTKETVVEESVPGEASFASAITNISEAHDPQCVRNYKESIEAYKNYWATYTDVYIFAIEEKKSILIDKLISAPATMRTDWHRTLCTTTCTCRTRRQSRPYISYQGA